jgi:N-acetylglucosamine-6-sulfatase
MRMMKSVDEGLGRMMETLDRSGRLDDTIVVLTSDHGYFYGEHGLDAERRLAYEEAIRIPLVMRYPRRIRPRTVIDRFALSVDLAPTMLHMAGAPVLREMQGRPLDALLAGRQVRWREAFLVEYFTDTVFPRIHKMGYQAVRTNRWKYIRYGELSGMNELYDLRADPYEMNNVIASGPRERMESQLQRVIRGLS